MNLDRAYHCRDHQTVEVQDEDHTCRDGVQVTGEDAHDMGRIPRAQQQSARFTASASFLTSIQRGRLLDTLLYCIEVRVSIMYLL